MADIGNDTITDYAVGSETLQFDATLWGGALDQAYLDSISGTVSGMLVLDFGAGGSVTFETLSDNTGLLADISLI